MNVQEISKDHARNVAAKIGLPAGPLSYTQVSTYLICPHRYKLMYVDKLPRVGYSPRLILGSVTHTGLETLLKLKKGGQPFKPVPAFSAMDTAFAGYLGRDDGPTGTDLVIMRQWLAACKKIVEFWGKNYMPKYNPTSIEESLYVLIDGIPMVVKLDFIDNDECVYDFKLSSKAKSQSTADNSLQLGLYTIGTKLHRAGFISLISPIQKSRKAKWTPRIEEVTSMKNPGDKEWTVGVVGGIKNSITLGSFPYCDPESWACSSEYCDCWLVCRGRRRAQTPSWIHI